MTGVRVGVDIGGTFTDVVALDTLSGELAVDKVETTPSEPSRGVLEALAKSGQRGLLLTGWGGLRTELVPDNVLVVDSAPHSWLFPRMAAVVHHGGAGTTAAGLRAGIPAVVCPFGADQAYWGGVVQRAGTGPDPIPRADLTVDRLAYALRVATTHGPMRQRAADLGARIRAEDGVGAAVGAITAYLQEYQNRR